jgi:preprotein translocase subunit SecE
MGRLLKKKDNGKQKKKKDSNQDLPAQETSQENTAGTSEVSIKAPLVLKSIGQKKTVPVAKGSTEKKEKNFLGKSIQFLREVKVELKKVTWPSKKQTIGSTVVVIVLVMIISLFLGVVDMSLSGLVRVVFQ